MGTCPKFESQQLNREGESSPTCTDIEGESWPIYKDVEEKIWPTCKNMEGDTRSWEEKADLHIKTWKEKTDLDTKAWKETSDHLTFIYKDKEGESHCLLPACLTLTGKSYCWVILSLALESTFSGFQHTVKYISSPAIPQTLTLLMENSHCWTFWTTVSKSS